MSTLATLNVVLNGDVGGFLKAMKDAEGQASLSVNTIKGAWSGITNAAKWFADGIAGAMAVAVQSTLDYAKSSRDAANAVGINTEEMQQLIQVADDAGVSQEKLITALQLATKNGFAPSIESLARLADRINQIQDPTKRAAQYAEIFGKNWAALNPILIQGGDAIRASADEARRMGLIMSHEALESAEKLRIGLDNLGDRVEGLKLRFTSGLIPVLNQALDGFDLLAQTTQTAQTTNDVYRQAIITTALAFGTNSEQVKQLSAAYTVHLQKMQSIANTQQMLNQRLDDQALQRNIFNTSRAIISTEEYTRQMDSLLQAKKHAIEMGFEPESRQLQIINQNIFDLDQKMHSAILSQLTYAGAVDTAVLAMRRHIGTLADMQGTATAVTLAMKDYNTQVLYSQASAGLPAEAQLELARSLGLVDEKAYDAAKRVETWRTQLQNGQIDLNTFTTQVYNLHNALGDLPELIKIRIQLATDLSDIPNRGHPEGQSSGHIPLAAQNVAVATQVRPIGGASAATAMALAPVTYNITINDAIAGKMWLEELQQRRVERLERSI